MDDSNLIDDIIKLSNLTEKSNLMSVLYIVGTPIGNLGDFSPRAVQVLSECDFIEIAFHSEQTKNNRTNQCKRAYILPYKSYKAHNKACNNK